MELFLSPVIGCFLYYMEKYREKEVIYELFVLFCLYSFIALVIYTSVAYFKVESICGHLSQSILAYLIISYILMVAILPYTLYFTV